MERIFLIIHIIIFIMCFSILLLCFYTLFMEITSRKCDWYKRYLFDKFYGNGNENNIEYEKFVKRNKNIIKFVKITTIINLIILFIIILLRIILY